MHLRENEHIMREIKRHKTPFVFSFIRVVLVSIPFYLIAYFIGNSVSAKILVVGFLAVSLFVGFFIVYVAITYILDRLVITNQRILFINWKSFWRKDEFAMNLRDIQDIRTRSRGIVSRIGFLNYGLVEIETASSTTCITFKNAPNPEGVKAYISRVAREFKTGSTPSIAGGL